MPSPEEFFRAYVVTALWSSNDESNETGGDPLDHNYDASDIEPETLARMRVDCDAFYDANRDDLNCDHAYGPDFDRDGRAGHDFWLTRNHHGAGFWDGGWPEPQATRLTHKSHAYRECNLYVGDDGKVHCD